MNLLITEMRIAYSMKKALYVGALLLAGLTLAGCSNTSASQSNSKAKDTYTSEYKQEYTATITNTTKNGFAVKIKDSIGTAKEESFKASQEVVLLGKEANLVNENGKKLTFEDFSSGDEIRFALSDRPIMTMSLPPQIPGQSIRQIVKL